jgi:hypothetical protein
MIAELSGAGLKFDPAIASMSTSSFPVFTTTGLVAIGAAPPISCSASATGVSGSMNESGTLSAPSLSTMSSMVPTCLRNGANEPSAFAGASRAAPIAATTSRRRKSVCAAATGALEQDEYSSDRHPAPAFWRSMIFFRKPVPKPEGMLFSGSCSRGERWSSHLR